MFEQKIFEDKTVEENDFSRKFATQTLTPKSERRLVSRPDSRTPVDPKQRRLMVAALSLLLVALCFVLYRDGDFWFPAGQEQGAELEAPTESTQPPTVPASRAPSAPIATTPPVSAESKAKRHGPSSTKKAAATGTPVTAEVQVPPSSADALEPAPPGAIVSNRTVLPPLEVEVVAGDKRKTYRLGTNSIRVDLQPGTRPQPTVTVPTETASAARQSDGEVTSNAAERVQMSADTAEVVSHPVNPGYPTLARQMKVQGAVILRALISKDG
ncbi:MAG TPA: hypothetical protein VI386_12965, partial [Candidatus Sulfotelmatobacter sp.]